MTLRRIVALSSHALLRLSSHRWASFTTYEQEYSNQMQSAVRLSTWINIPAYLELHGYLPK